MGLKRPTSNKHCGGGAVTGQPLVASSAFSSCGLKPSVWLLAMQCTVRFCLEVYNLVFCIPALLLSMDMLRANPGTSYVDMAENLKHVLGGMIY